MATISRSFACNPTSLTDELPCLNCLSFTELKLALVLLLAIINDYTLPEDITDMLEDAKCFPCVPQDKTLFWKNLVKVIAQYAEIQQYDVSDVATKVKCLPCLKPGQIDGLIVYLLCKKFTTVN